MQWFACSEWHMLLIQHASFLCLLSWNSLILIQHAQCSDSELQTTWCNHHESPPSNCGKCCLYGGLAIFNVSAARAKLGSKNPSLHHTEFAHEEPPKYLWHILNCMNFSTLQFSCIKIQWNSQLRLFLRGSGLFDKIGWSDSAVKTSIKSILVWPEGMQSRILHTYSQ